MEKKDKMFALVTKWRTSGLTRKEFAVQHNIPNPTFDYWCQKFYNEQKMDSVQPKFIELSSNAIPNPLVSEINLRPQIELEFSSGLRIKIY